VLKCKTWEMLYLESGQYNIHFLLFYIESHTKSFLGTTGYELGSKYTNSSKLGRLVPNIV
jgi:hypothetical protein